MTLLRISIQKSNVVTLILFAISLILEVVLILPIVTLFFVGCILGNFWDAFRMGCTFGRD